MSSPPPPPNVPGQDGGFQPPPGYQQPGYQQPGYVFQRPGYQPPGYQPYSGQPMQQGTSGMAIASLVCSLTGFFTCGITAVLGVIFGFVGLSQTKDDARPGRGLAIAGLVIGFIFLALWIWLWVAVAVDPDHCIEFGTSDRCG